ncbi:MAG: LPS export ABC transporter periplasmic protein LptC [Pseudomonadota bacterium]
MAARLNVRVLALLALALAGWWLLTDRGAPDVVEEPLPDELLGEPDLYLEGARIRQYTEAGILDYELRSRRLRHFQGNAITRVDAPDLIIHTERSDQPPWIGRAEKGFINSIGTEGLLTSATVYDATELDEERVYLSTNVVLEQRFEDGRFTRLRTEHLYLYPEREFVQTDHDVTIDTEVGRTRAAALAAYLEQGVINLKGDAEQRVNTIVLRDQFK